MSKHRIIGPGGQEMQKDMWHIEDFYPSDLELKTRKEVTITDNNRFRQ